MMDFRRQKAGQYVARYTNRFSIYRTEFGMWAAFDSEQTEDKGLVGEYGTLVQAKKALSKIQYTERAEAQTQQAAMQAEYRAAAKAKEEAEREERLATTANLRNTGIFAQVTITKSEALKLIQQLANYADDDDTVELFIRSSEVYGMNDKERPERLDISVGSTWTCARAKIVDSVVVPEESPAAVAI